LATKFGIEGRELCSEESSHPTPHKRHATVEKYIIQRKSNTILIPIILYSEFAMGYLGKECGTIEIN